MVKDTRLRNADNLLQFWDTELHSIYQFDHGLQACCSIVVMDIPVVLEGEDHLRHPLWMLTSTPPTITLVPDNNTAQILLALGRPAAATGAWVVSSMLLLPPRGILPIGFGVLLDKTFSHKVFLAQLTDQHGTALVRHVDSWLQGVWCDSWFKVLPHSLSTFTLPILLWNQLHGMVLHMLLDPENSSTPLTSLYISGPHVARHTLPAL